jgi:hypothetical protein
VSNAKKGFTTDCSPLRVILGLIGSFFGASNMDEMLLRYIEPVLKFKDGICFQLLELLKDYLTLEKNCLGNHSTPDEAKPSVGRPV